MDFFAIAWPTGFAPSWTSPPPPLALMFRRLVSSSLTLPIFSSASAAASALIETWPAMAALLKAATAPPIASYTCCSPCSPPRTPLVRRVTCVRLTHRNDTRGRNQHKGHWSGGIDTDRDQRFTHPNNVKRIHWVSALCSSLRRWR